MNNNNIYNNDFTMTEMTKRTHKVAQPKSFHIWSSMLFVFLLYSNSNAFQIVEHHYHRIPASFVIRKQRETRHGSLILSLLSSSSDNEQSETGQSIPIPSVATPNSNNILSNKKRLMSKDSNTKFDLSMALLCSGLAFDAYVEPSNNSSRWERGSSGLNVAFCSIPYTRSIYHGLIELTIRNITNLPSDSENDSTAERLVSGDGIDAYILAAIVEGQWVDDIQMIEKQQYSNGILDVTGAAHVSRTSTCWSTVTKEKAIASYRKNGVPLPYHIPAAKASLLDVFNQNKNDLGAQAVWQGLDDTSIEPPIFLYVQDPSNARVILTVMDDDRISLTSTTATNKEISTTYTGRPIGSTYKKLIELIPQAAWTRTKYIQEMKKRIMKEIKLDTGMSDSSLEEIIQSKIQQIDVSSDFIWEGSIPLLSKPRKKDKGNEMLLSAVAGAMVAGPVGAVSGAVLANFYERSVSGQINCQIRYIPLPPPIETIPNTKSKRTKYIVKGGLPGIDWGTLYTKYQDRQLQEMVSGNKKTENDDSIVVSSDGDNTIGTNNLHNDLEHCFFITHTKTGATCAVYRSLQYKFIVVSFRGTCAPIDLITDASLIQETWVEGEDSDNQLLPKVHVGFRSSMNSISRRLKELLLAVPAPGDTINNYDMFVTGHSLGGALATLFTADIGQYGIDAGRGLPQLVDSEPWWKAVVNTFTGSIPSNVSREPPRPKSLRLYNFGSPRVGNVPFAELFDALRDEGYIDQAYRIVNGDDVVARLPRTVNALVFGNINYEHVGTTVLLSQPSNNDTSADDNTEKLAEPSSSCIWIEGESDNNRCPVRDGVLLTSPIAEGSLLNDLFTATREGFDSALGNDATNESKSNDIAGMFDRLTAVAGKVSERVKNMKASDVASVIGIDRSFTEREIRIIQSVVQGKALAHHLEDQYYASMGRAAGFVAQVNEDIVEL